MPQDAFSTSSDSLISPARLAFPITPNDSAELPLATKALYIGSGGDVVLRAVGSDQDVTLRNVVAGTIIAIRVKTLRQSGTTAANLVGLA